MISAFGTVRSRTSRPTGTIIAPPMPWMTRAPTNSHSVLDKPHRIEPSVKTTMAERNIVRAPNLSAAQPLAGMKIGKREQIGGQRQLERDRVSMQIRRDRRQGGRNHRAVKAFHEQGASDDKRGEAVARQGAHPIEQREFAMLNRCRGDLIAPGRQERSGRRLGFSTC